MYQLPGYMYKYPNVHIYADIPAVHPYTGHTCTLIYQIDLIYPVYHIIYALYTSSILYM
jgi:hypothetical protein